MSRSHIATPKASRGATTAHSWIVALRFARREVRRAKGRTALVVVMIGLPIVALSFVAAVADMTVLTPSEQLTRQMGTASASLAWTSQPVHQDLDSAARVDGVSESANPHSAAELRALLPTGATATQIWKSQVSMHTAAGVGTVSAYGIDMASPITSGIVRLVDGRAPRTATEVVVSPRALTRLGTHIGATIRTFTSGAPYTVVGTVEVGGRVDDETVVFAPSQRPGAASPTAYLSRWLVSQPTPVLGDEIHALNQHGIFVTSRALVLNPPPRPLVQLDKSDVQTFGVGTLLIGLAVLEVVLLAGPAFAVGARRRQRELALVATAGGAPCTLRRIVLADGIVCGLIASVAGVVIGLALAFDGRTFMEDHLSGSRFGAYRVYPWAVVGVVGVAVLIGLLGALLPALTAGRQNIVATLSGRRGTAHASKGWLVAGIVFVAAGVTLAGVGAHSNGSGSMLAGLAVGEFGLVMCTPTFVGLIARLGRFLPMAPRLALRGAARRRAASAPAIAAVMAAVAGSIAASMYLTGQRAANHDVYAPSLSIGTVSIVSFDPETGEYVNAPVPALTRSAHAALPDATVVPLQVLSCHYSAGPPTGLCGAQQYLPDDRRCPFHQDGGTLSKAQQRRALADSRCDSTWPRHVVVYGTPPVVTDSAAVVAAVSGLTGAQLEAATATLRAGGILVDDPAYVEHGKATLAWLHRPGASTVIGASGTATSVDEEAPSRTVQLPAYAVDTGVDWMQPVYSPEVLRDLGGSAITTGVLVASPRVPTQADRDALNGLLIDAAPDAQIYVEHGDLIGERDSPSVSLILAAAAAIIALGAAAIATGLAAADSRRDLITLGALGATPRVRRILSLAQAAVISGTGSLIGVVAGFGAATAILTGLNQQWATIWPKPAHYPITVPWANIGIALVAVPLVAMLGAGLLTRSRLPSERRAD